MSLASVCCVLCDFIFGGVRARIPNGTQSIRHVVSSFNDGQTNLIIVLEIHLLISSVCRCSRWTDVLLIFIWERLYTPGQNGRSRKIWSTPARLARLSRIMAGVCFLFGGNKIFLIEVYPFYPHMRTARAIESHTITTISPPHTPTDEKTLSHRDRAVVVAQSPWRTLK